jgi:hypothetical protein
MGTVDAGQLVRSDTLAGENLSAVARWGSCHGQRNISTQGFPLSYYYLQVVGETHGQEAAEAPQTIVSINGSPDLSDEHVRMECCGVCQSGNTWVQL